jgi:hypothetical protein
MVSATSAGPTHIGGAVATVGEVVVGAARVANRAERHKREALRFRRRRELRQVNRQPLPRRPAEAQANAQTMPKCRAADSVGVDGLRTASNVPE